MNDCRSVTLYLPALFSTIADQFWQQQIQAKTPELINFFARSKEVLVECSGHEASLGALLQIKPSSIKALHPRAACILTPVFMHAGMGDLICSPIPAATLSDQDATILSAKLNQHFATDDLAVYPVFPDFWLLLADAELRATTTPSVVYGETVLQHMPDDHFLRAFMNEVQMLLFEHPHNMLREQRGDLPINALWPWWPRVSMELDWNWSQAYAVPAWAQYLFAPVPAGDELVVDQRLLHAAQREDSRAFVRALAAVESWVGEQMRQKKLKRIMLDDGRFFELFDYHHMYFWKRGKPLVDYAAN